MTIDCVLSKGGTNRTTLVSWFGVGQDEGGSYIELPNHQDKTVHFYGTFGGGTVTVHGSNDPRVPIDGDNAEWVSLVDAQGNPVAKTAAAMELIIDNPRFIKVEVTGGDGTTSINTVICAKQ